MLEPCFVQTLPKNAVPCRQGEQPEFVHVLLWGKVGLFIESTREESLIEFLGPGDTFLLPAALLAAPYLGTTRLLEESRLMYWPVAAFRRDVRDQQALAYGVSLQLAVYWRGVINSLKDLRLLTAAERLAAMLLQLAPHRSGSATVSLPAERRLVAGRLGITPQSLSRAFAALRPVGVSGHGREVTIASLDRLRESSGLGGPADPDRALGLIRD